MINELGDVIVAGRFGTDQRGYAEMLVAGRRFAERVWAVEGCNGVGKHIAHRLVHDGETVLDVPAELSAQKSTVQPVSAPAAVVVDAADGVTSGRRPLL